MLACALLVVCLFVCRYGSVLLLSCPGLFLLFLCVWFWCAFYVFFLVLAVFVSCVLPFFWLFIVLAVVLCSWFAFYWLLCVFFSVVFGFHRFVYLLS